MTNRLLIVDRKRHARGFSWIHVVSILSTGFGYLCYLTAVILTAWLVWNITSTELAVRSLADQTMQAQGAWPRREQKSQLALAEQYNQRTRNQNELSFGGDGSKGGRLDSQYMKALNDGDGVIGVLEIPAISFKQPIYHTTDDDALESGVGHVYGTALPTGDKGTHSALAAHTGSGDRTDFTRIRELHKGSFFYITVLGKQMGYKVDRIEKVSPSDFKAVTDTDPNQTRVTLVTCDPPLLNTERLLVSGVRESIPDPIPEPDTQKDVPLLVSVIVIGFIVVSLIPLIIWIMVHRVHGRHKKG
ncbi:class C sortase [Bifidobacterium sp. SO1]|uniref:class C sortase n=1 Tax=Bifidobacterium sp. SO1 TaxID=2809029 RepID=UPI001BDD6B0D|nr:class C sortase [Bifidobacterium sp. SO1]